jgi:hypothetical protein
MASYSLTKAADRKRYRQDHVDELEATKNGTWPRDINDEMRWINGDGPAYAARMCRAAIDYIDGLEQRIKDGDPDVASFEKGA